MKAIDFDLKNELHNILFKRTDCLLQGPGYRWPCATCFYALSKKLNNRDWQTVLFVRGDYAQKDLDNLPVDVERRIKRIIKIIDQATK